MSDVLVFDIWGELAHFKKPYTTTSPLTYSIPSRTTLTGIIGAIMGIEKNKNNELLDRKHSSIALRIMAPIKKVRIAENLINTKDRKFRLEKGRSQIKIEFLSEPKFRIYIELTNENEYRNLKKLLTEHKSVYTPTLGLSENLANFDFVGNFPFKAEKGDIQLHSVVPLRNIESGQIEFEPGKEYFNDTFAFLMNEEREVQEYGKVLFERNGETIKLKNIEYIRLEDGENVLWL